MKEGRILALDVGDVRIGVARSDLLGIIAQSLTVIQCSSPERDIEAVRDLAVEHEAVGIVVGMPLDQNGQPGPQARKVEAFIERLRAVVTAEIVTQDERFSTASAQRMLIDANVSRKGRKKVIDKVAAQQILQIYLDRRANQRARAARET